MSWEKFSNLLIEQRYSVRENGVPVEKTWEDLVNRLHKQNSVALKRIADDLRLERLAEFIGKRIDDIKKALKQRFIIPSTPVLMNWGSPTKHGCPFACFPLVPPEDDLSSIMTTATELAYVFKAGGGAGVSLSKLRSKGSLVDNGQGVSSGPSSFGYLFSAVASVIEQGGRRRGALMLTLSSTHPDVVTFMSMKDEIHKDSPLRACNISVEMHSYDLDLLKKIAEHAWRTGDPGVLFVDRQLEQTPLPKEATPIFVNPCAEYMSIAGTACNLFTVNVFDLAIQSSNWDEFLAKVSDTAFLATLFANIVLLAGNYPLPYIRSKSLFWRPVGVGLTGLHETLAFYGYSYGLASLGRIKEVQAALLLGTQKASLELAASEGINTFNEMKQEYDSFHKFDGINLDDLRQAPPVYYDRWLKMDKLKEVAEHNEVLLAKLTEVANIDACPFNAVTTTQMPTGTVSQLAHVISTGIEPVWDVSLQRMYYDTQKQDFVPYRLETRLFEIKPEAVQHLSKAIDVPWQDQLAVVAAVTALCHTAVSKTTNVPNHATKEEVFEIFKTAYKYGLKSVTVFRDGCREDQILKPAEADGLPETLEAKRYKLKDIHGQSSYVLISYHRQQPKECFIVRGKAGSHLQASMEALGRVVSLVLRKAPYLTEELCDHLEAIDDASPVYYNQRRFLSVYDAVSYLLRSKESKNSGAYDICPKCGKHSLYREGGCLCCRTCGYSSC